MDTTREVIKIIRRMAETGKPAVTSGRAEQASRLFTFVAGQLATKPVDYFQAGQKINSQTVVGKRSKHPIVLQTPVLAAAMSFGALSLPAKRAVSIGTSLAGTADNTGEGGMYPDNRKLAKILIVQYSTGRFGVTTEYLRSADAIEIKIGQGAKPGQGGLLPGFKVTEAVARARTTLCKKVEPGQTLHSPAYHHDILSPQDLRNTVEWLRAMTDSKPIVIKLGATDVESDVARAVAARPDVIAIDGREGGTGASPRVMLDGVGIPALPALVRARKVLDIEKDPPELWIAGGFNLGEEVAVALALGADAVFLGTSLMLAMGCEYCRQCYLGECKFGIATHIDDPAVKAEKKIGDLIVDEAAKRVANYIGALTEEVKMLAACVGLDDVHRLGKSHIRAFDPYIAKQTGVKTIWDE